MGAKEACRFSWNQKDFCHNSPKQGDGESSRLLGVVVENILRMDLAVNDILKQANDNTHQDITRDGGLELREAPRG